MINEKDIPAPKGPEIPSGKEMEEKIKQQIKNTKIERFNMGLPNIYGVENFKKLVRFLGLSWTEVAAALADDGKVSLIEGLGLAVKLGPAAFGLIGAIPQIPKEIVFDQVTEEEIAEIAVELEDFPIKGDTIDATKELLPLILGLKDWYFKWLANPNEKS
jgi:hypothetical protein